MKTAIIIGGGPAGLTAAYELVHRTDTRPVVYESGAQVGGISKTVSCRGNRIDFGGHRFFSKSDRVMAWWLNILPLQDPNTVAEPGVDPTRWPATAKIATGPDPADCDRVMLLRARQSRIYYRRRFFDYPVSLNLDTLLKLGLFNTFLIGLSYLKTSLFPVRPEKNLEDFFINRFGKRLYETFFREYTKKVWGVPCHEIGVQWGAQRVKGLSVSKAVVHYFRRFLSQEAGLASSGTETSLIEQFLYPKYGPGQMWEEVARIVSDKGGEVHLRHTVVGVDWEDGRIQGVHVRDETTGEVRQVHADIYVSTMPIKELAGQMGAEVPPEVREVADGLLYRDFITVGLLVNKLKIQNDTAVPTPMNLVPDNWIYIQEPEVQLGRIQIFNNWSPYVLRDPQKVWIGLEYFCNEGDELWTMKDDDFAQFAIGELAQIDIIDKADVVDHCLFRVKKAYPAYFGTYERFDVVRRYLDTFENLFLIGRNGMHRYNNQGHSMLTAMTAVENIARGVRTRDNIWAINTEADYHEERDEPEE